MISYIGFIKQVILADMHHRFNSSFNLWLILVSSASRKDNDMKTVGSHVLSVSNMISLFKQIFMMGVFGECC